MAVTRYLADKSVLARLSQPLVRQQWESLSERGLIVTCSIVEMELIISATSPADRDLIREYQRGFDKLPMPDEIWDRAIQVQCELVSTGSHRSVKIPDLLVAATAERNQVGVLHYDRDFDRIAEVTGQETRWVVPPGTAA